MSAIGLCLSKWSRPVQHRNGYNPRWRNRRQANETQTEIPEDLIEPGKVFVSDLRRSVTEPLLHELISRFVEVENTIIIKDRNTRRSRGYGFVKVKTNEDVEKLLALPEADRFIHGHAVTIKRAKKKITLPGDDGYVRQSLSDRDFDLSSPDPAQPSIHMLVDDVLFKIFSYLPTKQVVKCERVCRRWQMLLHCYYSKKVNLEITEDSLGIPAPFCKSLVSKLLILSGPNLRSLKVQKIDFVARQNILKIIGQLCPHLEVLDVSRTRGINFLQISRLAQGCKTLKGFMAKDCTDFDEKALHQLLECYPRLEKLDVCGTSVYGKNLSILPRSLKELYIERIPELCHKKNSITQIADKCPNIEVLELNECVVSKEDLEYFGKHCLNLAKLTVYMPVSDFTPALSHFKKLTDLTLMGNTVNLNQLFSSLPQLEVLNVDTSEIQSEDTDFSVLEKLKSLKITQAAVGRASLRTLAKCKLLEAIYLFKWNSVPDDAVVAIIAGCPKLNKLVCPSLVPVKEFVDKVDNIMKGRCGKLVIEARDSITLLGLHYDRKKIEFIPSRNYGYMYDPFSYDSAESDDSDVSFDGGWYDSDIDFPEYYLDEQDFLQFDDDLFEAAVMLAAWNVPDSGHY
ncbi:F-box/LRR-repeat protein 7-like isoform X4 [Eriocheir sinensis]|uniref:F-box/LRR-repeat protein 7-like isoform X4 n=1 Tax=Eriocheir sinensis TaxID=95602 RepID=UPI0021C852F1|nr:F-box/LRR-repeat protein 7-like isoform X4 [Eriocheir sinensis]